MNESIIFCGDLVVPYECQVHYDEIKHLFEGKRAIANLEGAILPNETEVDNYNWDDKFSLYSSPAVLDVIKDLNIHCVSLCNNHILDYQWPIERTKKLLDAKGVKNFGLRNPDTVQLDLNGNKLFVVTFATYACEHSLPLFDPLKVIRKIEELRNDDKDCLIVVYPHWGIEKNRYPEPADRTLAHRCIDAGANLVIGHHPHIIQHIEMYRGSHIIYSVGNFILPQTFYGSRKLTYKDPYIQNELVVEWDGENVRLHSLYYDVSTNRLLALKEFPIGSLYEILASPIDRRTISWWHYLNMYANSMKTLDLLFRSRYFATRLEEWRVYVSRKTVRLFRRLLIKVGIHKPYKITK